MTDREFVERARHAITTGAFAQAVTLIELGIAGPLAGNSSAWRMLGQARHMERDALGALAAFETALQLDPGHVGAILGEGHARRALGQTAAAAARYRVAIDAHPTLGEAWWSLAALKTVSLSDAEIRQLEALARSPDATAPISYALGAAMEQSARYDEAFAAWERGGLLRLKEQPYSLDDDRALAVALKATSRSARPLQGCPIGASRPIFIVGLPRAGSTLLERILAAHPDIAAADEPPYLGQASALLMRKGFPPDLSRVTDEDLHAVSASYRGAIARHAQGKANVVDKNPNNHWLAALIACALPDAAIIYARRDPLDQCVSAFGHLFARGFPFTSTLRDLGGYWRLADDHMMHTVDVFSGRVFIMDYERLVTAPELETRRLLTWLGLPWSSACLAFHATPDAIHTASAEQARAPISQDAIGRSRRYLAHLGPLIGALAGPKDFS